MRRPLHIVLPILVAMLMAAQVVAAELPTVELTIRNHAFSPDRITIPADQKVMLVVHNQDATPEEFESNDFNREKLILGGRSARIYVGPLKAGTYRFFGDFHQDSAQGVLVAE